MGGCSLRREEQRAHPCGSGRVGKTSGFAHGEYRVARPGRMRWMAAWANQATDLPTLLLAATWQTHAHGGVLTDGFPVAS